MSRHLIIRCDAPGCVQQTETSASDTAPTSIDVPSGWLTLVAGEAHPHRHYCSLTCLFASAPQDKPHAEKPADKPEPMPSDKPKGKK